MARLNIIGPCNPDLAAEVVGATGNVSISTLESGPGSVWSIRMNPVAGVAGARFQVQQNTTNVTGTWSQANVYLDYYIVLKDNPSATLQMAVITKAGGASQAGWEIDTSRRAQLWYINGAGVKTNIGALSAPIPRNVRTRITLVGTALATAGAATAFFRIGGVTIAQAASLTVTAAPANSGEVFFGTTATTGCDYHLSDIRVDNAAVPGGTNGSAVYLTRVLSLASGSFAGSGTTDVVDAVKDDIAPETTKSIITSSAPHGQLYNARDFKRWFGAGTVHAVKLHVQAREVSGTTSDVSLQMQVGASNVKSPSYTALTSAWSWLGMIRELAPDGTAWTLAKLDSTTFGVYVNALTTTTVGFATIYIYAEMTPDDGVWLFVDWYKRFHAGAREWPLDFEAFAYGEISSGIPGDLNGYWTQISIQRGRARSTDEIAPGRAHITLLNTAVDGSGDPVFNVATTASGGLDSRLGQLGHRVRIVGARNGNLYGLFYGYTTGIRQDNTPGSTPTVQIEAADGLEWMRTKWVGHGRTGPNISDTLGLAVGQTLGNRLGFTDTTIAPLWRIDPTTRSVTHYWYNGDALGDARKLAFESADDSLFFMDGEGRYRYRPGAWQTNNESLGTVVPASADVQLRDFETNAGAMVTFARFTDDTAFNVLWSMDVQAIPIPAGTSRLRVEWGEPAWMTLTLTPTTDYLVNAAADGSGANLTANVTISNQNSDGGLNWMTGGELVITNTGAAGYMTFGQWRGQRVFWDKSQVRTAGSPPYRQRAYEFMSDATTAQNIATALSNKVTDTTPAPRTTVTVIPTTAAQIELCMKLDLFRKALFQNTADPPIGGPIPLNATRTVQGLSWEIRPGAPFRVTFEIE